MNPNFFYSDEEIINELLGVDESTDCAFDFDDELDLLAD